MYQSNIIAIAGYKNSGKDTSAEMLRYLLNSPKVFHKYWLYKIFKNCFKKKYRIVSFAHPLKKTLAALLDIDIKLLNDRYVKEHFYVKFPELTFEIDPPKETRISDQRLEKLLNSKNFSFLTIYNLRIRQLLQVFGTEIMRSYFGDTLWINSTLRRYGNAIISDLRFKVEYDEIKKRNGITLFILNYKTKKGSHSSEKEIEDLLTHSKFDYIIDNNGTLKDLFYRLQSIV